MKVCVSYSFLLHCDISLHGKERMIDGKILSQEFRRRQDPEFSPDKVTFFRKDIIGVA